MTHAEILSFCERWLSTWTGNHPGELIRFYSDDAFYSDPAKRKGLQGKAQILPYFTKLLAKYPDWIWKAVEVFPTEKGFTLKWEARLAQNSEPFFGLDIVELKNGKISRNEVYFDPSPLALTPSNKDPRPSPRPGPR